MGLDMFLSANRYLMSYSDEDAGLANEIAKHFPEFANIHAANSRFVPEVKEISFRVGYWRKANAIHDWFVKNVQSAESSCRNFWICVYEFLTMSPRRRNCFRREVDFSSVPQNITAITLGIWN